LRKLNPHLLLWSIALISLTLLTGRATAQTFKTIYNFTARPDSTNSDGASPLAGLIVSNNILYGTAWRGGIEGFGTIFKLRTDGSNFTTLHSFSDVNNEGVAVYAGLVLSDSTLYGTAEGGGSFDSGTVFGVNANGTGFTNLHHFTLTTGNGTNSDGAGPRKGVGPIIMTFRLTRCLRRVVFQSCPDP
jgi:uncharacterized repeat protein (TIGR03803 family)